MQRITASSPRISIGIPVYNGREYLAETIESILCQTFEDFELVICDNASTDETQRICQSYALRDPRIRYFRNARNLGAAANYERCFELSSGMYFKWAAHDDLITSDFLQRCVEVLDAEPDVVLCHSVVEHIDEQGGHLAYYDPGALGTGKATPSERFGGRIRTTWCKEVFGLIRADILRDSVLTAAYVGSDQALLAELALRGRFVMLPDPLFKNRDHGHRSTRIQTYSRDRQLWYTTGRTSRLMLPRWILLRTMLGLVRKWVPEHRERWRCYGHLAYMLFVRGRVILLVLEPVFAIWPSLFDQFEKLIAALGYGRNRHLRLRGLAHDPHSVTTTLESNRDR